MEVLETARVDAYSMNSIVVPASKRNQILCVVWEGTCSEQVSGSSGPLVSIQEESGTIWHAGDWTGPISLQPERRLSGESPTSPTHDIVALSSVGVKVITIEMPQLHAILKAGSPLYGTYLERAVLKQKAKNERLSTSMSGDLEAKNTLFDFNVLELLNSNSALRKLNAVQKRHLECLAEGPVVFAPGDRMWRAGTKVNRAYLIVSGSCSFASERRNAGSTDANVVLEDSLRDLGESNVGYKMRVDASKVVDQLGQVANSGDADDNLDKVSSIAGQPIIDTSPDSAEFEKLSRGLQKRAEFLAKDGSSYLSGLDSEEEIGNIACKSESNLDHTFTDEADPCTQTKRISVVRRRSSRARHANKVLGRLYKLHASGGGLVFSRGHFLGDMSKMVFGLLANDSTVEPGKDDDGSDYGLGLSELSSTHLDALHASLHEINGTKVLLKHSSTLIAGKDGCVALVFVKSQLIGFLDEYPGILLSLLGTHAIV
jgi:hypothetical protein